MNDQSESGIDADRLAPRLAALPAVARLREAAAGLGVDAYLVGGCVRDLLLGSARVDLDVAVEGDPLELAAALGGATRRHERFLTAAVAVDGALVDLAATRVERYPRPGALPEVRPARLEEDLARRDFTVNAMAVALARPGELIDPHSGLDDLRGRILRDLHEHSFVDDPTRALRAARYAARLGLEPEPGTLARIRAADLTTVSTQRVAAELRRLAREGDPRRGFELLDEWGLVDLAPGGGELIERLAGICASPSWGPLDHREDAVLAAARGGAGAAGPLAAAEPRTPSEAVGLAAGRGPVELLLARAAGAAWLDRYVATWRHVRLEIGGDDLIAAGIPQGPAIGRGLRAALEAKLDGRVGGADAELEIALAGARDPREPGARF